MSLSKEIKQNIISLDRNACGHIKLFVFWIIGSNCCIGARTTWLPASQKYKRRCVSSEAEREAKEEVEGEAERQLWKDVGQ